MKAKILVVDDEESLVRLLTHNLKREGYDTIEALDGNQAWEMINLENPDLILLDLMLPGKDGLEICQMMRENRIFIPVIMLTAKDEEIDRILGLEMGADDYVTKPFSVRELMARVKAILRRRLQEPEHQSEVVEAGDLLLKTDSYEVFRNGVKIDLTLREFELLEILVRNRHKVLKRDYLLNTLWDYSDTNSRVLDVHISKLRDKIEPDTGHPIYIKTVRGIGYIFEGGSDD
ncbi:MAG: response regulator transcription factor [Syntrophomonadales bacterium]|jgi:two-component system alkaline phosphatase synthesis response regulator PhoP